MNNEVASSSVNKAGGNASSQRKYRVLIADDCETDRFFLQHIITAHAPLFEVVGEVQDGDEAIAYLWGFGEYGDRQKHPLPDLLIMDVRMPRVTGIAVLEWLATQKFPALKVAMLADSSAVMFKEQALDLGLKHFYPKSANLDDLIALVKRLQDEMTLGQTGDLYECN